MNKRKKSPLGGVVSSLYSLARITNNINHLLKGTIIKRLINIFIGRKIVSKFWLK